MARTSRDHRWARVAAGERPSSGVRPEPGQRIRTRSGRRAREARRDGAAVLGGLTAAAGAVILLLPILQPGPQDSVESVLITGGVVPERLEELVLPDLAASGSEEAVTPITGGTPPAHARSEEPAEDTLP